LLTAVCRLPSAVRRPLSAVCCHLVFDKKANIQNNFAECNFIFNDFTVFAE
jgi:hypothetical protein